MKITYPEELPIVDKRAEIVSAIREHQVVVITGDTGSGKSTQLPKMCLEAGRGDKRLIGCTQPRRIAAITLAQRVALELGKSFEGWVGHKIRFQDRTSRKTRIKFMTDGILLAETQSDRLLRAYDTIIVDEAHERSLNIDFLLGILRRNLRKRRDLKVIITSATIDPEKFSQAFRDAPIVQVSGRTYPVTVWYRSPAGSDSEDDEVSPVDQTLAAVKELQRAGRRGDVLVFMPTESDIREAVSRLEAERLSGCLVLPLFGRMAGADQQRVFRPSRHQKIIVATNVAETSITIPGIKYVIDTGLVRIAQYNARSRTQGLPIVPVSRASADQRKGRCGRVAAGICIRLYGEDDYLSRPDFTPPEIQRSNLAEVILRMLHLRLGDIKKFPFLDPPSPAAIKDGFAVLRELGAVDDHRRLTKLGGIMARFPLDPRLSRMLIEAKREKAVREMIVLCAALSIQDPRERPMDREKEADQIHNQFKDRRSDFVTLLKLWQTFQDQQKTLPSQNQVRKFCREHFLSYRRMREWQDTHREILEIVRELGGFPLNKEPADFDALHRCVTSGYLSNIGMRKDKNIYLGTKGRQLMVFPGSGVFNKSGDWIVASELVHTSRLFARTVAVIQPEWLEKLGKHICRYTHLDPHWEKRRGQVAATERVSLYGLQIVSGRKINYGRINPEEAREIFIRSALVENEMPGQYAFLEHNRALLDRIEKMENKIRRRELRVDDDALFDFYDRRLPAVHDIRTFKKWLKKDGGDQLLRMTEQDLLRAEPDRETLEAFPDVLKLGDLRLPLHYNFEPGSDEDGMTVVVPLHALPRLSAEPLQWLVQGMLEDKITALLRSLPKYYRRQLVPIPDTVRRLLDHFSFGHGDLYVELSRVLRDVIGVHVPLDEWTQVRDSEAIPVHLRARFEIVADDGRILGAGRDLQELKSLATGKQEDFIWEKARQQWERGNLTEWDFGDLPSSIELGQDGYGMKRVAYPGIVSEGEHAAIRLFADPEEAREASRWGLMILYQWEFKATLKALRKEWTFPAQPAAATFFMGDRQTALHRLQLYLLRDLFDLHDPASPNREAFMKKVDSLKGRIGQEARLRLEEVLAVISERYETQQAAQVFEERSGKNPGALERLQVIERDLQKLVPHDFLDHYRRTHIQELPRYLKALRIRLERAYVAPEKDRQKEEILLPHLQRLEAAQQESDALSRPSGGWFLDELRWMVEELKISLFAPEVKTRMRISNKRLEEKWREWQATKGYTDQAV